MRLITFNCVSGLLLFGSSANKMYAMFCFLTKKKRFSKLFANKIEKSERERNSFYRGEEEL